MADYTEISASITGVSQYDGGWGSVSSSGIYDAHYTGMSGSASYHSSTPLHIYRAAYKVHIDPGEQVVNAVVLKVTLSHNGSSSVTFSAFAYRDSPNGERISKNSANYTVNSGSTVTASLVVDIDTSYQTSGGQDVYIQFTSSPTSSGGSTIRGTVVAVEAKARASVPALSLSLSPTSVAAGNNVTATIGGRYDRSLNLTLKANGVNLTPTPISVAADSKSFATQISWFGTASATGDSMTVTATVTDPQDGRTASRSFTLTRPELGVTASPSSVGVGGSVSLTFSKRLGMQLSIAVSCKGSHLATFSSNSDSTSFTVQGSWLSTIKDTYATLDITVTDSAAGRTASTAVDLSVHALEASVDKASVKTGDPIEITLSNRYGESVTVRFKDGSALIQSDTYSTDTIKITPDISWFTRTGNTNDSMSVSVEIVSQSTERETFLSFDLTRPVLSVSATSPVTAGNSVTLAFSERNGSTLTVKLRSGNTVLASPDSFSADGLTVATQQKWFQDLSVTTQNYIEVTVDVTASDGRTASTTFRLEAGDDMAPTISGITFSAEQPTAAMANAFPGIYVAGHTRLKVSATVSAKYSASAWQVNFTIAGSAPTEMSQSSGSKWEGVSVNPVTINGDVVVSAVDSRGLRSESKLRFSSLTAYSAPSVSAISFHRCREDRTKDDSGGYCLISATFTISPVENKNSKSAAIASSVYSDSKTLSSYTQTFEWFFAADIEHSYEITLSAIDTITRMDATVKLSTAGVIMDFLAGGKGIGLGKVAEYSETVEVNPEWTLKVGSIELNGSDLDQLLQQIDQRLRNGGL